MGVNRVERRFKFVVIFTVYFCFLRNETFLLNIFIDSFIYSIVIKL